MEREKQTPKTPLTEDVVQELIDKGYDAVDLVYMGHLSKEDVLAFTPEDFSNFADSMAKQDDRLLGS